MLMTDTLTTTTPEMTSQLTAKEFTKKKRKSMMELKKIKDDVESGAHGKWEKLYKKICDAIKISDQIDQGSSSSDDKMDYSVLYAKV